MIGFRVRTFASRAISWYGVNLPYHRGKWRLVDGLCSLFDLHEHPPIIGVVRRDGFLFQLDLHNYIDRTIYYLGLYEGRETAQLCRLSRQGGVVVDAGANIGWHTLHLARAVGPRGRVYAFEPAREDRERLVRNIALNQLSNIEVTDSAIGARTGTTRITQTMGAGMTRLSSDSGRAVPITTLDDFIRVQGIEHVDLVKVDIEGAEEQFLRGAQQTLRRDHPTLMMELHDKTLHRFGSSREALVKLLSAEGYQLHSATDKNIVPLEVLPSSARHINVFALPK